MAHTARISFNGETHQLPTGSDLPALMDRIESAARGETTFVTFAALHESVSVLVGARTNVTLTVDTADGSAPLDTPDTNWAEWDL